MDAKERQYKEQVQTRENRVKEFMSIMEGTVVAEENKKHKLLEDNVIKYEEKRQRQDYFEDENRKKKIQDRQVVLR